MNRTQLGIFLQRGDCSCMSGTCNTEAVGYRLMCDGFNAELCSTSFSFIECKATVYSSLSNSATIKCKQGEKTSDWTCTSVLYLSISIVYFWNTRYSLFFCALSVLMERCFHLILMPKMSPMWLFLLEGTVCRIWRSRLSHLFLSKTLTWAAECETSHRTKAVATTTQH